MKSINWKCVEKEHEDSIEGLNPSIKKYLEKVSIADRKKSHCSKTSISNIAKNEKISLKKKHSSKNINTKAQRIQTQPNHISNGEHPYFYETNQPVRLQSRSPSPLNYCQNGQRKYSQPYPFTNISKFPEYQVRPSTSTTALNKENHQPYQPNKGNIYYRQSSNQPKQNPQINFQYYPHQYPSRELKGNKEPRTHPNKSAIIKRVKIQINNRYEPEKIPQSKKPLVAADKKQRNCGSRVPIDIKLVKYNTKLFSKIGQQNQTQKQPLIYFGQMEKPMTENCRNTDNVQNRPSERSVTPSRISTRQDRIYQTSTSPGKRSSRKISPFKRNSMKRISNVKPGLKEVQSFFDEMDQYDGSQHQSQIVLRGKQVVDQNGYLPHNLVNIFDPNN